MSGDVCWCGHHETEHDSVIGCLVDDITDNAIYPCLCGRFQVLHR
jgi:hypothetical protein